MLCYTNNLGSAEGVKAVHEGDADVDLSGLTVGISCSDAFAKGFDTQHLCFDAAPSVVSGPVLPERPSIVLRGAKRLVPSFCCWAVFLPGTPVLPDRDDWCGLSVGDGRMAAAGVVGTISCHRSDLLVLGDLSE